MFARLTRCSLRTFGKKRLTEVYELRIFVLHRFGLLWRIIRLDSLRNGLFAFFLFFRRQPIHFIPRGDNRYAHFISQTLVNGCAPLYLDIVSYFLHEIIDLVNLLHHNRVFRRAVELQQDALCAVDVIGVDERRIQRVVDGVGDTFLAGRMTDIHNCHTTLAERIAHISEVGVDISRNGDNFRNRARCVRHHVIRLAEGIEQVEFRIDLFEFLIIDDEKSIHVFGETCHTCHGFLYLLLAFEGKRDSDDTYRQNPHLLRHFGDNRRSPCTGSATHSGGDEQHLRTVVQRITDMIPALFCVLTRGLGVASGTQTRSQLQFTGHR